MSWLRRGAPIELRRLAGVCDQCRSVAVSAFRTLGQDLDDPRGGALLMAGLLWCFARLLRVHLAGEL